MPEATQDLSVETIRGSKDYHGDFLGDFISLKAMMTLGNAEGSDGDRENAAILSLSCRDGEDTAELRFLKKRHIRDLSVWSDHASQARPDAPA